MKIDFGYGEYVDAAGPRTEHHRNITAAHKLRGCIDAWRVTLECGHQAEVFGASYPVGRLVPCTECRDMARK